MVETVIQVGLLFSSRSYCISIHTFDEARVGTHEILEICVFKYFFKLQSQNLAYFRDSCVILCCSLYFPSLCECFIVLSFHYVFLHVWNESITVLNSYLLCFSCSFQISTKPFLLKLIHNSFFAMHYVNGLFMFFLFHQTIKFWLWLSS